MGIATSRANAPLAHRSLSVRSVLSLAVVAAVLIGVNISTAFGPAGLGLVVGPAAAVVLVGIARRIGLTWNDLGLARHTWRKGAVYGGIAIAVVAVIYAVGALLPFTRDAFLDVRYDVAIGSALLMGLIIIPIKTVLIEEIAFRGVLLGMLKRPIGTAWGIGLSSVLFGLWHVLPAIRVADQNQAIGSVVGSGLGALILTIAAVVVFTVVAGVLFSELRRRSGSLLSAAGLHWATNGLGVVASSVLWAAKVG